MLKEHGTRLEADFQRFYNIDLADLYRGELGVRKAAVLAVNLPPESATMRAEGGNASLTGTEHQLRAINHRLDLLMYQNGGGKGSEPKAPKAPDTHREIKEKQKRLERKSKQSMSWQESAARKYGAAPKTT